jgi:hypothetical protein
MVDLMRRLAYPRLGIALCDAFIACWRVKYEYNLLRPITYIRANIDPTWGDPLPVTTPPFPEYTSGHSVQSGAAISNTARAEIWPDRRDLGGPRMARYSRWYWEAGCLTRFAARYSPGYWTAAP